MRLHKQILSGLTILGCFPVIAKYVYLVNWVIILACAKYLMSNCTSQLKLTGVGSDKVIGRNPLTNPILTALPDNHDSRFFVFVIQYLVLGI